jgi:hypothetical protein
VYTGSYTHRHAHVRGRQLATGCLLAGWLPACLANFRAQLDARAFDCTYF